MKAAVFRRVEDVALVDVPVPVCGNDTIRIRVMACGVCSTDVRVRRQGHKLIAPPRILGHEVAGVVVEVGAAIREYELGDRIAVAPTVPCGRCRFCIAGQPGLCDHPVTIGFGCDGGFAEYMLIPPKAMASGCVIRLPDSVSYAEAALAEPLACCINAQTLARIGSGQTIAIIGAGPLGCMHAMLARSRGAARTILIDVLPERIQMAHVAGADIYMDAIRQDPVSLVRNATGGSGPDSVIIACELEKALALALAMVAKRGTISLFSRCADPAALSGLDVNTVHFKELVLVGGHGSSPQQSRTAIEMIAARHVAVANLITHRIPLNHVLDGFTLCERKECLRAVVVEERGE